MSIIKTSDKERININPREYFHISFNGTLGGVWEPKLPDGDEEEYTGGLFDEPDNPRISVSPNIEKCFRAIYANIARLFEVNEYPYLDFHVYTPTGNDITVCSDSRGYVHDAHITDELIILDAIKMERIGKVRVANTSDLEELTYRPFNKRRYKERFHSPKRIEYKWLTK